MKKKQRIISLIVISVFVMLSLVVFSTPSALKNKAQAENLSAGDDFNQTEALAKLRESIKGKEKEPAETVFKNIQTFKGRPAAQLLAIMELGYSRSLGVTCTHCHTPEDWSSESKNQKQVARDMAAMTQNINTQLLKNIKNINEKAVINCTTCHRGQVTPALNLPPPSPKS
ncbi:MAG: c-type cytochrome [Pyrinomonadaceae bacterium]|nr:c-type cytochrome [Pyrinomonadaceae bacterium]